MTEEDRVLDSPSGQSDPLADLEGDESPEEQDGSDALQQGGDESLELDEVEACSECGEEDHPGEVGLRGAEELETELEEMKDAVLRARADFENFRKRMRREQSEVSDRVAMSLLGEFLPVMDNFERAVSTAGTADMESFAQGVQMILRQMSDVLEAQGVRRMTVKGAPFDPRVHEAVSVLESEDVLEEVCSEEVIPGYTYKYKVLRPAQVQVAKPKRQEGEGNDAPKGVSSRELRERLEGGDQEGVPNSQGEEEASGEDDA